MLLMLFYLKANTVVSSFKFVAPFRENKNKDIKACLY